MVRSEAQRPAVCTLHRPCATEHAAWRPIHRQKTCEHRLAPALFPGHGVTHAATRTSRTNMNVSYPPNAVLRASNSIRCASTVVLQMSNCGPCAPDFRNEAQRPCSRSISVWSVSFIGHRSVVQRDRKSKSLMPFQMRFRAQSWEHNFTEHKW